MHRDESAGSSDEGGVSSAESDSEEDFRSEAGAETLALVDEMLRATELAIVTGDENLTDAASCGGSPPGPAGDSKS
jgi:hypothetical protein